MRTPLVVFAALLMGPAAPALADVPMGFRTPSDNIHCLIFNDMGPLVLQCELRERDPGPPLLPQPVDCDLEWGNRFGVAETGPAGMACHGDTLVQQGTQVLPYGTATQFGPFTCESATTGLTCRNADGHGFFLSRAEQGIF